MADLARASAVCCYCNDVPVRCAAFCDRPCDVRFTNNVCEVEYIVTVNKMSALIMLIFASDFLPLPLKTLHPELFKEAVQLFSCSSGV